jgi:preprotein translocase subunit Sec61beta
MNYPHYTLETTDKLVFYFESESITKIVPKVVVYTPIFEGADVY